MTDRPALLAERWIITGRVQGVGYRDWLVETATALGVAGSVRNLDDAVEAHVQGPAHVLNVLHTACLSGPPAARPLRIDRAASSRRFPSTGFSRSDR